MSNLPAVTDATFHDEVIASDIPVLVDFWAPWCGPCRQVAPILDQLEGEINAGGTKLRFVAMNIDENPATPSQLRVTGIPTLAVFENGQVVKTIVGAKPKATLAADLAAYIR